MTVLGDATISDLRQSFGGELVLPGDAGYDGARAVFNAMIDRRPAVVARCASTDDVVAALAFARANSLPVSVHGGGHSVPGYGVCDDGVMIDLSPMKGVHVDPERRIARAEAGLTWGELDAATQEHGLATTGGRVSTTGIAGLSLASGSGWLERKHGLTGDNMLAAQVVTADGQVISASDDENAELFWGLRGGGGNFGIVTEIEYALHPVGPLLLAGLLVHPADRMGEVIRFYRDFIATAPDEVGGGCAIITAPPEPFVPEDVQGTQVVGIVACYFGDVDEGERMLAPLRAFGPPAVDLVGPMPYTALQSLVDGGNQPGFQNYWKAEFVEQLSDAAVDTIVEHAARIASPLTQLLLLPMGGALARPPARETALGHRDAAFNFHAISMWSDPAESERHIAWARDFAGAMQPFVTAGVYPNFVGDEGEERLRSSYGERTYARLVALKDRYDPENVFRLNQNVRPGGG